MNHYVNFMNSFEGKDDIPSVQELQLFSETESDEAVKKVKKPKTKSKD